MTLNRVAFVVAGLALAGTAIGGASAAEAPACKAAGCARGAFTVEVVVNDDKPIEIARLKGGSEADYAKVYPLKALRAKASGQAHIRCEAMYVCGILHETVGGYGFGAAAVKNLDRIPARLRIYPFEAEFTFLSDDEPGR